jgi:hypothetical protein
VLVVTQTAPLPGIVGGSNREDSIMTTMHTADSAGPRLETTTMLVMRIKAEYLELPGLQLTPWQAQRLWGLDRTQCDAILEALVDAAFLRRTRDGSYARMS